MYTSVGPVLIAVNPYKQLEKGGKGIYSSGVRDYYHRKVFLRVRRPVPGRVLMLLYVGRKSSPRGLYVLMLFLAFFPRRKQETRFRSLLKKRAGSQPLEHQRPWAKAGRAVPSGSSLGGVSRKAAGGIVKG